jgi:hypothetical protein
MGRRFDQSERLRLESYDRLTKPGAAQVPQIRIANGGPVEKYLAIAGMKRSDFEDALRNRQPNAVTLFAAETVFQEVQLLVDQLQFHVNSPSDQEKSF